MVKAAAGCLLFAAAMLLAGAGGARANPIYTFTLNNSACCGSGPFGTVAVTEETGSTTAMDFTVTLNSPYQFHKTTAGPHPVMALDINVGSVTFSNFKLNNVATSAVTTGGANTNVAGYGSFPYTLKASSNLNAVLTFTASVATGTLNPTNIVSNGSAYLVVDIINQMSQPQLTGNVAAVNPPVRTPEPASIGLLGAACAGLLFARRKRGIPRGH